MQGAWLTGLATMPVCACVGETAASATAGSEWSSESGLMLPAHPFKIFL